MIAYFKKNKDFQKLTAYSYDAVYAEKNGIKTLVPISFVSEEAYLAEIERISNKIEGLDLLDNNNEYKDAFYFIEELKQKKDDHMTKEEYNKYIKNVENICVNYEQWFNRKTARISKKSK